MKMNLVSNSIFFLLFLGSICLQAESEKIAPADKYSKIDWSDTYPKKDLTKEKNPLASEFAEVGGMIVINGHQYPKGFNYFVDNSTFTASLFDLMYDSLLSSDPVTLEKMPSLVEKWEISSDKKMFRMHLNPKAKWSDGKPITSHDVLFTYQVLMDPKNLTAPFKVSFSKINEPVVIDERTFVIEARETHWNIYNIIAGIQVLPKHEMGGKDFNKIAFEFPVVSGSYKIKTVKDGQLLDLERRKDWWQRSFKSNENTGNFEIIRYKFFQEDGNGYEAFIKGEIDYFAVYMSARWIKEAVGDKFDNNWIVKQRVYNYEPSGFQGFAFNMRRDLFKDRRVREAMACLLNRERFNKDLMYSQYQMSSSYYSDLYGKDNVCSNKEIKFDVEKAKKLLAEAGWKPNKNGLLEKDGKTFEFKFLTRSESSDRFLDIYMDDLIKVGIKFTIDRKDGSSWSKDMDSFNYDMTWAAWGGGLYKDPEGMWDSKQANQESTSNITGFQSKEVDALIEAQKTEFDINKRNEIVRQVDKLVTDEVPYILLWHIDYHRLLYWNKFGTPPTILGKFAREDSAVSYWWYDEDAVASLENAKKKAKALPKKPAEVRFDEAFEGK